MTVLLRVAAVLSLVVASDAAAQVAQPPGSASQSIQVALTDIRIAYLSPQRAFAQSTDGKAAQARLTALETERTKEIEARNRTLRTRQQALEQDAAVLSEPARAQRQQEIEKFQVDLQRFIQDAQSELMGVQQDLETAFLTKLRPALDQVVKDKSLVLVLNEDVGLIAWADPALDITRDVLDRLNR